MDIAAALDALDKAVSDNGSPKARAALSTLKSELDGQDTASKTRRKPPAFPTSKTVTDGDTTSAKGGNSSSFGAKGNATAQKGT